MHPWDQLSNFPAHRAITQFFSQNLTEIMWGCTSGFLQRLGMVVWPGAVNISERRSKSRIRSDDRSQPSMATGQLPFAISFLSQFTLSSQSHPVSPLVLLCLSQRERPPSATALPAYYTFCPNSHSTRRCACRTSDITITLSSIPGIRNLLQQLIFPFFWVQVCLDHTRCVPSIPGKAYFRVAPFCPQLW